MQMAGLESSVLAIVSIGQRRKLEESKIGRSESSILILDAGHLSLSRVPISSRNSETKREGEEEAKKKKDREKERKEKKRKEGEGRAARKKGEPKKLRVGNAVSERQRKRSSAAVAQFYRIRLFMRNIHRLKGARTLKGVFTLPRR